MCYLQCCNKVVGKPPPETAGSRGTLHSFFSTLEKSLQPKPALALLKETHKSDQEEEKTGEAIMIGPPDGEGEDEDLNDPEDLKAGAKATSTETKVAISRKIEKTERHRRKAERGLRRARKARRQLCLAPDAISDQKGEGPAGENNKEGYLED